MNANDLAVAISQAEQACAFRARAAGVADPEAFGAEFIAALRTAGWRFAPSLARTDAWAPGTTRGGIDPSPAYIEARASLGRDRPARHPTIEGEA